MSNWGSRASGSDGSDWMHREKVADHYKVSLQHKSKLKNCIVFNLILVALHVILLAAAKRSSEQPWWQLEWWNYCLLGTVATSIIGLLALPRNNSSYVKFCIVGNLVLGIGGVTLGALSMRENLINYLNNYSENSKNISVGLPLPLLWYIIFSLYSICFLCGTYYACKLVQVWQVKTKK